MKVKTEIMQIIIKVQAISYIKKSVSIEKNVNEKTLLGLNALKSKTFIK